jgi:hypothetical protein
MSLRAVPLDPYLLARIYDQPLVPDTPAQPPPAPASVPFLGENKKNILILIQNPKEAFLSDEMFGFLTRILQSVHLNMGDVALVNTAHCSETGPEALLRQFKPNALLLFGEALPAVTQDLNQVVSHNGIHRLCTDDLETLAAQTERKRAFWVALQQLFKLK